MTPVSGPVLIRFEGARATCLSSSVVSGCDRWKEIKVENKSYEFLKKLMSSISPPGYEDEAAVVWKDEAEKFADEFRRDLHGNSFAIINPGGSPRIMLAGHYDEIGFTITYIDDKGFIWFAPIGGWDPQVPVGQHVTIRSSKGHVPGVIGKCPIHLQKEDARKQITKLEQQWVDIGARNRKEAEKLVSVGDPMVITRDISHLVNNRVCGRGFDNRAGAFVVLEAARRLSGMKPGAEISAVATVQEEIGLRGARTAAYGIDPTVGIAVDVTFATDYPTMDDPRKQIGNIEVGKGVVVTRGPNINPKLYDLLIDTARKEKIAHQINVEPRGTGTDANVIQTNRSGVATGLLNIPNRYMHTPCEMVSMDDLDSCIGLIAHSCARITDKTDFVPF